LALTIELLLSPRRRRGDFFALISPKIFLKAQQENFRVQTWVVIVAVLLFAIKVIAYLITHSVAILTDALESTVNVIAGFIGLYSLYVAAKPRDEDHPYGHGKAEFLSAGVEGTLILVAGLIIVYTAVKNLIEPPVIEQLDRGIILVAGTALINFIVGTICVRKGKQNNSLALIASGKHLQSDTWSTVGLIIGLGLILWTGKVWLDSAVAIVFAIILVITGYKIIRTSVAGIMDEVDKDLLTRMVKLLNENRRENWIDLHNLRVIKYGGQLHVDCHLTLPWYLNLLEAHDETDALRKIIKKEFGDSIEMFVHVDPCLDFSCSICHKENCGERLKPFEKNVEWTLENSLSNRKHSLVV